MTETTPTRRIGFKRWIVLALILLGIYFGFIAGGIFKPVSPATVRPTPISAASVARIIVKPVCRNIIVSSLAAAWGAHRYHCFSLGFNLPRKWLS